MAVNTDGIVELWQAVILQAARDAGTKIIDEKRPAKKVEIKRRAIVWLTNNSEDLRLVCRYAQLDPQWVRRRAIEMFCNY